MSIDRGFTWTDDETERLIEIYSKNEIQSDLTCAKRNIGVFERVAAELSDAGYNRTACQCREKVKRLRKEYNAFKNSLENNGTPRKPMKYFQAIDKLIKKVSEEHAVSDVSLSTISSDDIDNECDDEEELYFRFDPVNSSISMDRSGQSSVDKSEFSKCKQNIEGFKSQEGIPEQKHFPAEHSSELIIPDEEETCKSSEKDSLDDEDSLWIPNVLLVENEDAKITVDSKSEKVMKTDHECSVNENESLEPQTKKKRVSPLANFLTTFTGTFLNIQSQREVRFLERIAALQRERILKEERSQRLWLELEERRRDEEHKRQMRMLRVLEQMVEGNFEGC